MRLYSVCVKINNDELFCNTFPFDKIKLLYFWIDLDVVRSTGNLSSATKIGM